MSSHSSNLPLSENTENDSQLTQMDHPDSIDGKFNWIEYKIYFGFILVKKQRKKNERKKINEI